APASSAGSPAFRLTEAASAAGLSFVPGRFVPHPSLANLAPRLGSLGVSVAVTDYDGDGWPDVFVSDPSRGGRNRLFRNKRDGTFVDAAGAAGLAGAGGQAGSMRALFFDSRNSGRQDLLLTTSSCAVFFANLGDGTFRDETARSGLGRCGVSYATNALDYDGDGFLDVVVADYFKPVDFADPADYAFMPNSGVAADNGGPIVVYHNERDGSFRPAEGNLGIVSRGWTLAVGVYDLRGSGRPDLWFSTDFNSDKVYFNEGGGRFKDASRLVEDKYSRNGMSAEIADVDNDGRAAVYVTNIHQPPYALGTNMLWKWLPGGRFADVAGHLGIAECGWSWGAKFLDLDNDGLQDLVVTNGYISADPKRDYWYESGLMTAAAGPIVSDARNWPPMKDASLGGYQKKCVYRNAGWRFEDVTDKTGWAGDRSDGRGLAAIDVMNDGSLSLLEANEGQPLRFYRNEPRDEANLWLGFKLIGTRSNRDAFGARVQVRLKGRTLSREVEPANGFMSQSDGRLHFGLGREPALEEVVIRWPSGTVQR
ncbi:MAG: CRTAC1 family protein, partial [Elusimicrobia bacterium]|nr:CRTAC1 family protein [Elusimicrobiota bacterium]